MALTGQLFATRMAGGGEYYLEGERVKNLREYLKLAPHSRLTHAHEQADETLSKRKQDYAKLFQERSASNIAKRRESAQSVVRSLQFKRHLFAEDLDELTRDELAEEEASYNLQLAELAVEEQEASLAGKMGLSGKKVKREAEEAKEQWRAAKEQLTSTQAAIASRASSWKLDTL